MTPSKPPPVSRVYDVNIAPPEKLPKPKDQSNVIARLLVQFMVGNRLRKPLQKLSAAMQETELMHQVIRRAIDNVDYAVFEAAMRKGMQYVQDSDAARHWSARVPVQPQPEHQDVPKLC